MGVPSNPGWPTGFVPTSSQWASAFSSKMDYPGPVNQGGTGAIAAEGASYNLLLRGLIGETPFATVPLTLYGVQTSIAALTIDLPAISAITPGDWLVLLDIDYNAAVNNITVAAFGSDEIALFGASASTQTLNISGVCVLLMANLTSWTMVVLS